jgi:hypothetical protein
MQMNISKVSKRVMIGLALALLGAIGVACEQGAEGDRCNPDLSHDECDNGLACTQPVNCPENYCCPTSGPSSDPNCQPGCNGGLAAICAADPDASACQVDSGPTLDGGQG